YGRFSPGLTLKVSHDKFAKAPRWGIDRLTEMTKPVSRRQTFEYFGVADPDGAAAGKDGAAAGNKGNTAGKDGASAGNDVAHVFIGQGTITRAGAPALLAENQLRGIPVQTELGGELGNVDEVVIDLARGRVAYVLLARGGYLGSGEEWIAAPIQAFEWHGLSATVDMSAEDYKLLKGLDRTAYVPQWVRERDLKELYGAFDVKPYWQSS
ncbi:MAG: PRC-barrel domain-containing protein, partial [Rhodospirillaceae bacterium]